MTVEEMCNKWYTSYAEKKLAYNTKKWHHYNIKRINKDIGKIKLSKIKTMEIQNFIDKLEKEGLQVGSLYKYIATLKNVFKLAVKWKLVPENLADGIVKPKYIKSEMNAWTQEEVSRFLKGIKKEEHYLSFLIALTTGMRQGEIAAMDWENYKDNKFTVKYSMTQTHIIKGTKKEKWRSIPLMDILIKELEKYKKEKGFICLDSEGNHYHNDRITRLFQKEIKRLNKGKFEEEQIRKIKYHDLRHTFATLWVESKGDIKVLSDILGHAKIETTYNMYVKIRDEVKRDHIKDFEIGFAKDLQD